MPPSDTEDDVLEDNEDDLDEDADNDLEEELFDAINEEATEDGDDVRVRCLRFCAMLYSLQGLF